MAYFADYQACKRRDVSIERARMKRLAFWSLMTHTTRFKIERFVDQVYEYHLCLDMGQYYDITERRRG